MKKQQEENPRSSGGSAWGRTVGDGWGAAHDAMLSITVSWQRGELQDLSHIHTPDHFILQCRTMTSTPLHKPNGNILEFRVVGFSLCWPGCSGWQAGRNMFTWPLHLRDWQPGIWEGAQVLDTKPSGTPGALWMFLTPILFTQLAYASVTTQVC